MGKPSSYQHTKKSDHSLNSSTIQQKIRTSMSNHKMETVMKKMHNKTKKNIKNLFETLRRQSSSSLDSPLNQTTISLDKSDANDTVINTNNPNNAGQKRKIDSATNESTKRRKGNNSLIVIPDDDVATDDVVTNSAPCPLSSPNRKNINVNCSTPINRRDSKTLKNMIIKNFNNNISDQNVGEDIINLTKEIHRDSYLTIDLTTNSEINKTNNTVIDLDTTVDNTTQMSDCTVISVSNDNLSMSGDSDVTVLKNINRKSTSKKLAKGISKLNSNEKGKLLELIAQKLFNGCNIPNDVKESLTNIRLQGPTQEVKTEQDTFIKEVILGETKSRNSIGSNIYHPSKDDKNKKGLRMIVIDGSNVAMEHTKGSKFSVKGLKICIDYFVRRGHVVKAFVPRFRCKYGKSTDPRLLDELERQGLVVYTPSREIQGRLCVSYDDRYIVQCAAEFDGVIVSGDNYRDLLKENPRWRFVIENRVLPFTWVNDMIMFPKDPLGRNGPTLEEFLRHPVNTVATIVL